MTLRPRTIARLALAAIAIGALLFGPKVRLLAVPLELALVWLAVASVRRALQARAAADPATALRVGLTGALGDNAATRAIAAELAVLWYALFSWGRPAPAGFTAHRRAGWIAIYFAILLAAAAEGIPLHFLLPRGWALFSNVAHVYMALWLIGDLRAMVLRPIRVEDGSLRLRIGVKWEADIPLADLEAAELTSRSEGRRLGVLGSPNLVLRLRRPAELHGLFGIRRSAQVLSLQVDDPEALACALGSGPTGRPAPAVVAMGSGGPSGAR